MFHHSDFDNINNNNNNNNDDDFIQDNPICLICLTSQEDDPSNNECVVLNTSCSTCRYYTHDSCFAIWFDKRNKCVWCRNRIEEGYDTPPYYDSDDNNNDVDDNNNNDVDDDTSGFDSIIVLNPFRNHSIHTNTILSHRQRPHSVAISSSTHSFIHSHQGLFYSNIYNCILFIQFIGLCVMLYSCFLILRFCYPSPEL